MRGASNCGGTPGRVTNPSPPRKLEILSFTLLFLNRNPLPPTRKPTTDATFPALTDSLEAQRSTDQSAHVIFRLANMTRRHEKIPECLAPPRQGRRGQSKPCPPRRFLPTREPRAPDTQVRSSRQTVRLSPRPRAQLQTAREPSCRNGWNLLSRSRRATRTRD